MELKEVFKEARKRTQREEEKYRLKQCPYEKAITCIMDEPCKGCEHYKGSKNER